MAGWTLVTSVDVLMEVLAFLSRYDATLEESLLQVGCALGRGWGCGLLSRRGLRAWSGLDATLVGA